jgi:hypothetical protein
MFTHESGLKGEDQMKKSAYAAEQSTYALHHQAPAVYKAYWIQRQGILNASD